MGIMKVFRSSAEAAGELASPSVAVGNFDGVHLGHQALFRRARALAAGRGGQAVGLTFSPHPARFFNPDLAPPLLNTEEQKIQLMQRYGLDAVVLEPFNADLAALSPLDFASRILAGNLGASSVVVGQDFVFGRKRAGNLESLRQLGGELGFEAQAVGTVRAESIVVSSTKIREFLLMGRVRGASVLLGREYVVSGTVVEGRKRGRTIGIPTANVEPDNEVLPLRGVYVGRALLPGGGLLPAVINIGTNPTFEKAARMTLEVHLLDYDGDLYGETLGVSFVRRLRDELRFSSVDNLVKAIREDIAVARSVLGPGEGPGLNPRGQ
jgi:riboflavin kinase/FMN adenylyltransferase